MKKQKKLGVVIGRFQVPNLHEGHCYLIERALQESSKLLIVLGLSGSFSSNNDPLDFETRKQMILSHYKTVCVVPLLDASTDEAWSQNLDALIEEHRDKSSVTIYGSRDSFLPYYLGTHPKKYIYPKYPTFSGTQLRAQVSGLPRDSEDFRVGMMYASSRNFPTSFQAVDVVIRHSLEKKVLVGRKAGEKGWRFAGGFVDPKDKSLELAAKREATEEMGDIEIDSLKYLGSFRTNDFRYRKSEHKLMTVLFSAIFIFGSPKAHDDLVEVRWQEYDGLLDCLVPDHKVLGKRFLETI